MVKENKKSFHFVMYNPTCISYQVRVRAVSDVGNGE